MDMWAEVVIAIAGAIAAIFGVWKVYISLKEKKENSMKHDGDNNTIANPHGGTNVINSHGGQVTITTTSQSLEDDASKSSKDFSTEIKLAEVYTSLFAEESHLKTEQIRITSQDHGRITGTVFLKEVNESGQDIRTLTYSLTGQFSNKVLTAEYVSNEQRVDERGAINLKLIDSNLLSGFCSFSKVSTSDDEIRVSPYVWVAGENKDLLDGTYDFCTDCYKEKAVCCCASEEIDMPVFIDTEEDLIRSCLSRKKRDKKQYSSALAKPFDSARVRQIIRDTKKTEEGVIQYSKCHFFDYGEKKCRIYNGRPIDCRIFPFDIKLSGDCSEYVIGYYPDLCDRDLPDLATMKKYAHILRPYFYLLYPYLHIITSEPVCSRLNNATFRKIANFKDFVF